MHQHSRFGMAKAKQKKLVKKGRKSLDELSRLKKVGYEFFISGPAITFKEVAQLLGVNAHTVSDWAEKERWIELRDATASMPSTNTIALHAAIQKIHETAAQEDRTISNDEADAIAKLAASIERFNRKLTPSNTMQVLMNFQDYLKVVDLNLCKQFLPHMKDFVARELNK